VRLEGLGKLKKSTSPGIDPATFRLVAEEPAWYQRKRNNNVKEMEKEQRKYLQDSSDC
jgi:hypothetical protein